MARRPAVRRLSKLDGRTSSAVYNGETIPTLAWIRSMAQHYGPCRNTRRTQLTTLALAGVLGSQKSNISTDYEKNVYVRGGGRFVRLQWASTRMVLLLQHWLCSDPCRLDRPAAGRG